MPKKKKNGVPKGLPFTEKDYEKAVKKREGGETLNQDDLNVILWKAAEVMKDYVQSNSKVSPINYVSMSLGVDVASLNSYFFTSYGVFQKDVKENINPYIAYTIAIIHALNLGYLLGTVEKGKKREPRKTTRKTKKK